MGANERSVWFWSLAAGVAHVVFVTGVLSTLWSSHFGSLDRLSQRPSEALPRLLEDSWPWITAFAIVAGLLLGATAVRRVLRDEWKLVAARSAIIAFLPVFIELTNVGVQNGRPEDLDLLPTHSMILLVLIVVALPLLVVLDIRALRRPPAD